VLTRKTGASLFGLFFGAAAISDTLRTAGIVRVVPRELGQLFDAPFLGRKQATG
jgi:hypothetical protein